MKKGEKVYILERSLYEHITGEGPEFEILGIFASKASAVKKMGDEYEPVKKSFIDNYVTNTYLKDETFTERMSFDCETPFCKYESCGMWEYNGIELRVKEYKVEE